MSRSLIVTIVLLVLGGGAARNGSSREPLDIESLLSQPVRPIVRPAAPPARLQVDVDLQEEEIATPPPAPAETTLPPVREISVDTRLPAGRTPRDYSSEFFRGKIMADDADRPLRNWIPVEFHWEPAAHTGCQPLCVVEPQIDDGDDSDPLPSQSAVSIASFFDTGETVPLKTPPKASEE